MENWGKRLHQNPALRSIAIVTITFRYERALEPRVREPDRGKGTRFTSAYNAFNSFADGAAGNGCMPALSESFCRDGGASQSEHIFDNRYTLAV